jgi:ABC-2 type transport system permease protein
VIRWVKIKAIATFEFLGTVKRPGYLITTFGMPVFLAIYAAVVGLPAYYMATKADERTVWGVVDRSGVLSLQRDAEPSAARLPEDLQQALAAAGQQGRIAQSIAGDATVFRPFPDEGAAQQALAGRHVQGYFVVPPDYLTTGAVRNYEAEDVNLSLSDAREAFGRLIRERLVAHVQDGRVAARILEPIESHQSFDVGRNGQVRESGGRMSAVKIGVPLAFMVLFLMSVLMTSGYLIQGTATEKENKVVEVLLASANPDEVLAGKLIGLGGAGLLQIAVWMAILTVAGVGVVPLLLSSNFDFPWTSLALALPLFLLGFLFFGSMMMGTGSLGSNMREAQQLAMVWSLTAALPLMLMGLLLKEPHGIIARVMTIVPITAAPVIMLRASLDPAYLPWWEVGAAFVVLAISSWIALRIGGRLFRIGLLSAGSRPTFKEIIRQARLAG